MRINEEDYNALVEKFASEMVESALMEKSAAEEETASDIPSEDKVSAIAQAIAAKKAEAEKEDEDDDEETEDKKAEEEMISILEKAAATYQEGEALEKAATEAYQTAMLYKDAATRIFEECGILDEE